MAGGASGFLQLDKTFLPTQQVKSDSLRARDGLRHASIPHSGIVDFPVQGSSPLTTALRARRHPQHRQLESPLSDDSSPPIPTTALRGFSVQANPSLMLASFFWLGKHPWLLVYWTKGKRDFFFFF